MSRSAWVTIGLILTFLLAFPAAASAQGKPGGRGQGGGGHGGGGGGSAAPPCLFRAGDLPPAGRRVAILSGGNVDPALLAEVLRPASVAGRRATGSG